MKSIAPLVGLQNRRGNTRSMDKKEHRKAKMSTENKQEAAKLREIWDRKSGKPTQAEFGETYGIGSQAAVGLFLNGVTPLSMKAAKGFAAGLGCGIAEFSPRLAKEATEISVFAPKTKGGPLSFLDLNRLEAQLVGLYRDLPLDKQEALMKAANKLHASEREKQR